MIEQFAKWFFGPEIWIAGLCLGPFILAASIGLGFGIYIHFAGELK